MGTLGSLPPCAGSTAAVRSAQVSTEPLCFTGYGPGGVAGAAGKAGYPTGTGKENLAQPSAQGALITQAPEPQGRQGLLRMQAPAHQAFRPQSEPGEDSRVGAVRRQPLLAVKPLPHTHLCQDWFSWGWSRWARRCKSSLWSLSPSPSLGVGSQAAAAAAKAAKYGECPCQPPAPQPLYPHYHWSLPRRE